MMIKVAGPSRQASYNFPKSQSERVVNGRNRVAVTDKHFETHDGPQRDVNLRIELDAGEEEEEEEEEEERLLDGVGLDVQEAWLCEDLIYALQVSWVACARETYTADGQTGRRGLSVTVRLAV